MAAKSDSDDDDQYPPIAKSVGTACATTQTNSHAQDKQNWESFHNMSSDELRALAKHAGLKCTACKADLQYRLGALMAGHKDHPIKMVWFTKAGWEARMHELVQTMERSRLASPAQPARKEPARKPETLLREKVQHHL